MFEGRGLIVGQALETKRVVADGEFPDVLPAGLVRCNKTADRRFHEASLAGGFAPGRYNA